MKGYLQRLALGVIQPAASSIHPIVGSVFSPAQRGNAGQQTPLEESNFSRARVESRPVQLPEQENPEPRPMYVPLMAKEPAIAAAENKHITPSRSTADNLKSESQQEAATPLDDRRADREQKRIYAPVMASLVRPVNQQALEHRADLFAATTRQMQFADSRRSRQSSQPDEIQIHIGRIEVTAVQPTPAPVVTRAARKALSLDEYLQRANRRGR